MIRQVIAYKTYFIDFYKAQDDKVQLKIEYVLDLVRFEKRVPTKFFKQLENTDGIYEVRVITANKSIRILCFFDDGNLIVLANCFVKKTQKTPRQEIKKAERIKTEYLNEKHN
ncbi:type II toxin-antitoxin system RelE/ParE family toxin [Roseivirga echinicomitans]